MEEKILDHLLDLEDEDLKKAAAEYSLSDLVQGWFEIPERKAAGIFLALDQEARAQLISELPADDQQSLLTSLSAQGAKDLLKWMPPDDFVDLLQNVSQEVRENVLGQLNDEERQETDFLLKYDDDDAAGLMTPRYAAIRSGSSVGQTLTFLRQDPEQFETIYYIYVIDSREHLLGVVSLKQLLMHSDDSLIADIMEHDVISVREDTDQEETAKVLETHDLIALPVVDKVNKLLGIVTFDDVMDVIREEQSEDVYRMGAIAGDADNYMELSVPVLAGKRLPWLVVLLLAGTVTTNLLAGYEGLITHFAFLALFIPVITQTGGNSGTQSSTLIIRGLATGHLQFRCIGRALFKELTTGCIIGAGAGAVIFARSLLLPPGVETAEALAVSVSLTAVVVFATVFGCLIPFVIDRLGGDPAVAAGPLMSTFIDVTGLTIYFEVSRLLLT